MQGMALRDNQDAYYYQQATLLAYEMQDRIRGNDLATADCSAVNNSWLSVSPNYSATACAAATGCSAADMATNDYGYWKKSVEAVLPAPKDATIKMVDIQLSSSVNKAGCKGTYSHSLCLITTWARINNKDSNKASKLSNTATFYLEVTP
jgi:Tfp pilus assembly protein PilV